MYNNNAYLIGRLTRDAHVGTTKSGAQYAQMTIAVDNQYNQKNTNFVPVTIFSKNNFVKTLTSFIKKGSLVAVQGHLSSGTYMKNNSKVYYLNVVATSIHKLTPKKYDQANASSNQATSATNQNSAQTDPFAGASQSANISDKDLPF